MNNILDVVKAACKVGADQERNRLARWMAEHADRCPSRLHGEGIIPCSDGFDEWCDEHMDEDDDGECCPEGGIVVCWEKALELMEPEEAQP